MESSKESVEAELVSINNQIESVNAEILRLTSVKEKLVIERENINQRLEEVSLRKLQKSKDWSSRIDFPWSNDMNRHFKESFQLAEYRPYQVSAINSYLSGHDVIVIMPTGGGKSLCYQLASVTKNKGFTLVN